MTNSAEKTSYKTVRRRREGSERRRDPCRSSLSDPTGCWVYRTRSPFLSVPRTLSSSFGVAASPPLRTLPARSLHEPHDDQTRGRGIIRLQILASARLLKWPSALKYIFFGAVIRTHARIHTYLRTNPQPSSPSPPSRAIIIIIYTAHRNTRCVPPRRERVFSFLFFRPIFSFVISFRRRRPLHKSKSIRARVA